MEFGLDYLAGRQVTSKHDMAYSLLLHKTFSERTIYPPIRDSSLCGLMALLAFNPKNLKNVTNNKKRKFRWHIKQMHNLGWRSAGPVCTSHSSTYSMC